MLLLSCGPKPAPTTPKPIDPCAVPAIPEPPVLDATACQPDQVCIPTAESLELTRYIHAVKDAKAAIAKCPLVNVVSQ